MKGKRLIVSLFILVAMVFNSATYALAPNPNDTTVQDTLLLDIGHGEFKLDKSNAGEINLNSTAKKVKAKKVDADIYEIVDRDALAENAEYNKLIKVKDDTLLRVKELKINLLNSKQVEEYIEEYNISPEMAKDIRERAVLAQEKNSKVDSSLVIYTPNFSKKLKEKLAVVAEIKVASLSAPARVKIASLSYQSSYYYTGYNNQKYKDEIWYGKNSPAYYNIRTGYSTKDYFDDVINNLISWSLGALTDTVSGGPYSIIGIFANSPIVSYPAHSGDVWQAALNEAKWRKYTSIELWDDVTSKYNYYVRAVSDRANTYFSHYLYRAYNASKAYADNPTESFVGSYYYSLDRKAYLHMYDLPYTEYISKYSVNSYTNFASQ